MQFLVLQLGTILLSLILKNDIIKFDYDGISINDVPNLYKAEAISTDWHMMETLKVFIIASLCFHSGMYLLLILNRQIEYLIENFKENMIMFGDI